MRWQLVAGMNSGCCPDVVQASKRKGQHMHKHTAHHVDPHHGPKAADAGGAMRRLKQLLLLLCVAQLMVILDITAVNVAMPDMAKGLDIAGGDVGWTITSY